MICSCDKAQSQGTSFQFSRFLLEYETSILHKFYFIQFSAIMYLFVNHLVLAKSEETSMYFTICKETGIHSLTRSLYVKFNNCVELYESMERIKAHFCNERTLLDRRKPTL